VPQLQPPAALPGAIAVTVIWGAAHEVIPPPRLLMNSWSSLGQYTWWRSPADNGSDDRGPVDIAHPGGIAHPGDEHPAFPNVRQPCHSRSRLEQLEGLKASLKEVAPMRGARFAGPTMTASGLRSPGMKWRGPARSCRCAGLAAADHLDCPSAGRAGWPESSGTDRVYSWAILRPVTEYFSAFAMCLRIRPFGPVLPFGCRWPCWLRRLPGGGLGAAGWPGAWTHDGTTCG
jgi:hypothetical protein